MTPDQIDLAKSLLIEHVELLRDLANFKQFTIERPTLVGIMHRDIVDQSPTASIYLTSKVAKLAAPRVYDVIVNAYQYRINRAKKELEQLGVNI